MSSMFSATCSPTSEAHLLPSLRTSRSCFLVFSTSLRKPRELRTTPSNAQWRCSSAASGCTTSAAGRSRRKEANLRATLKAIGATRRVGFQGERGIFGQEAIDLARVGN